MHGQDVGGQMDPDIPDADRQDLPEEPLVQGGILSQSVETHLEPRPTQENLESLPFDDTTFEGSSISTEKSLLI